MHKILATVVVAAALSTLSGCAREERWTYDGSRPSPLDDRTTAEIAAAPAQPGEPRLRLTDQEAKQRVHLVQEGDVCKVRSTDTDTTLNITATLLITPGSGNVPTETVRYRQVVVPPLSETVVGRTKDPSGGNQWSYRLVSAQYNRVR